MRIQRFEVFLVKMELKQPFRIALGETVMAEGYLVRLETKDGLVGFGEASPSKAILGDDMNSALISLKKLAKELFKVDPLRFESWSSKLSIIGSSPSARAAVDIALYDLIGKSYGTPLYKLLGGDKDSIETDYTIGIKSTEEAVREALELVKIGFRILKIKVGERIDEDLERVRAIREAVKANVKIRVDVNQGWTFKEAVKAIKELNRIDIELLEQPLKAHDLRGLAKLRKISQIPIMLDESVHNAEDAMYAIKIGAADVINIKLMKSGGISEAVRIAHVAEAAEIPCMIGCMSETDVGILAGIHLACGLRNILYADLDADLMVRDKILCLDTIKTPYRIPPNSPGLGFDDKHLNFKHVKRILEVTRN